MNGKLVNVAVGRLRPYAKNARLHSDWQVDQIVASIKNFGWTIPLLIDENDNVVCGHGRLLAAKKMGMSQVPCYMRAFSDDERRKYIIYDNRYAEMSQWDDSALAVELAALGMELPPLAPPQLAPVTQSGEGDGSGGAAGDGVDDAGKAAPIDFVMMVTLTPKEHAAWKRIKSGLTDSEAVKRLLMREDDLKTFLETETK
ncbi:MAG: ParB/Srx family N-terminal domain-containing protein [Betaproteobacteria bacterium]|nr:ParB/Srx family N-terminal domain-containing protein [Betaproteobacteria bacterium]